jgi:hypothetical protein
MKTSEDAIWPTSMPRAAGRVLGGSGGVVQSSDLAGDPGDAQRLAYADHGLLLTISHGEGI